VNLALAVLCAAAIAAPVVKDVPAPDAGTKLVPALQTTVVPTAGVLSAANLAPTLEVPALPVAEVPPSVSPPPSAASIEIGANADAGLLDERPAPPPLAAPESRPETKGAENDAVEAAERFDKSQRYRYKFVSSERTPAPSLSLNAASRNPTVLDYLRGKSFKDHLKEARRLAVATAGSALDYAVSVRLRDVPKGEKINGHTRGQPIKKQSIRMTVGPEPEKYDDTDVQSTFFHEHGHAVLNVYLHKRGSLGQKAIERGSEVKRRKLTDTEDGKFALAESKLYHGFADPSRELFADVFRILVMRAPGATHRPRDFSKMEEALDSIGGEKHVELNPFRARLWNRYLEGKLDDASYRARLLAVLARVCYEIPERHFIAAHEGGPASQDGEAMNREFIEAFDSAMSAAI
jgi:hypothetical protein